MSRAPPTRPIDPNPSPLAIDPSPSTAGSVRHPVLRRTA